MKSLAFNLIPEKPKELIKKEEERDTSAVYTAILPLFAVVLWLVVVLFNGLVINRVKTNWQSAVNQKQSQIETTYKPVLVEHGELVIKTQALSEVIIKDIRPEKVFELTEILFPLPEPGVSIIGYGRDKDGSFNVNLTTDDYGLLAKIVRRFNNYDGITGTNLKSANLNTADQQVEAVINFFFREATVTDEVVQ